MNGTMLRKLPWLAAAHGLAAARLAAALALALPLGAQETDSVYLRDGSTEVGKVLEMSFTGVSVQPEKGAKKTLANDNVVNIEFFDAPEDLQSGHATLLAGNFEVAREQLKLALATEGLRPVVVQEILADLAYAEQRQGNLDGAIAGYTRLLADFPKGRYLRQAGENLIALQSQKGNADGARASLDKLTAGAKGVEGIDAVVALLEARLLEAQKKTADANARYAALEGMAGADPVLVQEAKLGKARTLLHNGKAAEAEPIFKALISESANARVQSGAWNGLGEIQVTEGRAKKDADKILDALYAYLRTVVQYKPLPGESTEEYERALEGAATCFQYLSELEQNPEKKKIWRDRENDRREQLQTAFPNSTFAKK